MMDKDYELSSGAEADFDVRSGPDGTVQVYVGRNRIPYTGILVNLTPTEARAIGENFINAADGRF